MHIERLGHDPIVHPGTHPSIGTNIQGPSVIHAPPWLEEPLGAYYLYFADHKGSYIRLAYSDRVAGPWTVHEPGALQLADSGFPVDPPAATEEQLARIEAGYRKVLGDTAPVGGALVDATTPHVASPDVHLDHANQRVVMYFHGLERLAYQCTRVATSADGVTFNAHPDILGHPYFRVFRHRGTTYALAMPGHLYRSADGVENFEPGHQMFDTNMRHSALWCHDDVLEVLWTQVGDAPESILWSRVDLTGDWSTWQEGPAQVVLQPDGEWEGATAPVAPSRRGAVYDRVNQLRDPALFQDGDAWYLFYAGGGESAIGVAQISWDTPETG